MYLWDKDLSPENSPLRKVIKTVIYGVRPNGNLAECMLRKTAELTQSECPKAYDIIMNDMYVNDCMSAMIHLMKRFRQQSNLQNEGSVLIDLPFWERST